MPHKIWLNEKEYRLIPRVSDLVSAYSCQMTAVLNPINSKKKDNKIKSNMYALRGTIIHHRIEQDIRKSLGFKEEPLVLNPADQRLYKYILKNKSLTKELEKQIDISLLNFYSFMDKYGVTPISPEEKLVYIHKDKNGQIDVYKSLKGTIDLIGEVETENGTETVLIDWKTADSYKEEYQIQLTAYKWLFYNTGRYDEMKKDGLIKYPMSKWTYLNGEYDIERALLVLLGDPNTFKANWVNVHDETEFFRAQKTFRRPKETFRSMKKYGKHMSLKLHCMVCSYRDECPFYCTVNIDEEGENSE